MKNCIKKLTKNNHELEMTVTDFKNIQDALSEIQEPPNSPSEEKPTIKKIDLKLKEKYEETKLQLEILTPQLLKMEKYKEQVEELCKANIELKNKYSEMEKDIHKKIEK